MSRTNTHSRPVSVENSKNNNGCKTAATAEGRTRACGYLRSATGRQAIQHQRKLLCQFAKDQGYDIIQWYADVGLRGNRHKRVSWMKLLADAPTAEWEVVLAHDRSRFGRMDSIEEGFAMQILREAGKTLHTVTEGLLDWHTSAGRIIDTIRAHADHEFCRKLGRATLEGRLIIFERGGAFGQTCPYGMARSVTDSQGHVHVVNRKERFTRPKEWPQTFIPGDPTEVKTARWLFTTFAKKDVGCRWLAHQLNAKAVPSPNATKWHATVIHRLLDNPVYVGDTRFGLMARGTFARLDGDRVVRPAHNCRPTKKEPLIRRLTHEGIVERALWDQVQAKLRRRQSDQQIQ